NMSLHAASRATAAWHPTQFLSILDLTPSELESCLDLARSMKAARQARRAHATPLQGHHVALLFEKPSLRTRSTFQIAVRELGDGNNVAVSLAQAVAMLGGHVIVASPAGFELPASVVESVTHVARFGGGVTVTSDPADAVASADAIYTDVWASMGQEGEAAERRAIFTPYQVNTALLDK